MTSSAVAQNAVTSRDILAAAADLNRTSVSGPRLLARICDPQTDAREIRSLIEHDVHLTVRVLRIANSALYGRSRNISRVDQAITMLGLDAIRSVVVASGFRNNFGCMRSGGPIDHGEYYRHSIAVALAAEKLAKVRHPELAPNAFVAGLLHDYGVQIQARLDTVGTQRLKKHLQNEASTDASEAEASLTSVGHEECAMQVLKAWSFPEPIVTAAAWHHRPGLAPEAHRVLTHLVNLADSIACSNGAGFAYELNRSPPDQQVMQFLEITSDAVEELAISQPQLVNEFEQLLS